MSLVKFEIMPVSVISPVRNLRWAKVTGGL